MSPRPAPSLVPAVAALATVAATSDAATLAAAIADGVRRYPQRGPALRTLALATVSPSHQNVLWTGAPGTAKTALFRYWARLTGGLSLARTLSAWTDDAAFLGPWDVGAVVSGVMRRAEVAGRATLLNSVLVLADELPRAGKGIRDLLLSSLADRETPDGDPVTAHVIVSAANTRLSDADDAALVDRMTLRCDVGRVTGPDLRTVITRRMRLDGAPSLASLAPAAPLDPALVLRLRARAALVVTPGAVADAYDHAAAALRMAAPSGQSYPDVSERRWDMGADLLHASAVLADRDVVTFDDVLSVLPFMLDDGPDNRAGIDAVIRSCVPAWIGAVADVRKACDAAVTLAYRVEVEAAPTSKDTAQAHKDRGATLRGLANAVSEHGPDASDAAHDLVDAALIACDAHVEAGLAARRAAQAAARRR